VRVNSWAIKNNTTPTPPSCILVCTHYFLYLYLYLCLSTSLNHPATLSHLLRDPTTQPKKLTEMGVEGGPAVQSVIGSIRSTSIRSSIRSFIHPSIHPSIHLATPVGA
jgi:hypothetical protein